MKTRAFVRVFILKVTIQNHSYSESLPLTFTKPHDTRALFTKVYINVVSYNQRKKP